MKGTIKTVRGKDHYFVEGKEVTKAVYFRTFRPRPEAHHVVPRAEDRRKKRAWPMKSLAMKVHSKKIAAALERDRRNGVPPTDYTPRGEPVWTSERHKRAYNKALGVHDNNAYF